MSETCEGLRAVGEVRKIEGRERRNAASIDYPQAADAARQHGMELIRHSDTHYKLRSDDWVIEVYPGNRRICGQGGSPYLKLPPDWTLMDIVNAAVKATKPSKEKS